AVEAGLGEQIQRRAADVQSLAARFDLMFGLFARAVQHWTDRPRHVRRRLQQQRRLADARFAAEQHERSWHDAAAEDAIELIDARREPRVMLQFDVRVETRRPRCRQRVSMFGVSDRRSSRLWTFLDKRIPGAAVVALAEPLRRL